MDPEPVNISVPAGHKLIGSFRHLDIRCDELIVVLYAQSDQFCGAFKPTLHIASSFLRTFPVGVRVKRGGRPNATSPATGFRFLFSFVTVGIPPCVYAHA